LDEQRLIERAKSGDAAACARLVRAHYAAVYRLLAHLTRDAHAAEDLCQETFAAAWVKLGTFAGGSTFATWLHRIAYRRFLDSRRSAKPGGVPTWRDEEDPPAERGEIVDPLAGIVADEQARALYAALDQLDASDRQVLAMHYLSGLSYREMAEVTGEPAGTIKWRTSTAIERLRAILKDEAADELGRRPTTPPPAARPAAAADPAGA
jgi:RNA polymerase sigma-70 factor (ECF subfamily)